MRRRAFTIMELVVAIALLAIVMVMSGLIFRVALGSYRRAASQTEIMRKLRLITRQLDDDFQGFNKQAPVFIGWAAQEDPNRSDGLRYLDRIVFFVQGGPYEIIGNTNASVAESYEARISYMLASVNGKAPQDMSEPKRILARTQHILTYPRPKDPIIEEPNNAVDWAAWHNDVLRQYDNRYSLRDWSMMDLDTLREAMTGMTGMDSKTGEIFGQYGIQLDLSNPRNSIHKILAEGVGKFRIQGWNASNGRWVPSMDGSNTDGNDMDLVKVADASGLDYSGMLLYRPSDPNSVDDADRVLARALKFTFTLYDSKGLIKNGMTFTHIVNLDR